MVAEMADENESGMKNSTEVRSGTERQICVLYTHCIPMNEPLDNLGFSILLQVP